MENKQGLTSQEVAQRTADGLNNAVEVEKPKSSFKIILEQSLTLFNLYLVIIAIALIAIKEYLSVFFINVMVMNIFIQSYQIIRSVKTVNQLNVLIAQTTKVMRDGVLVDVANDDLVMDDLIYLKTGNQVAADCILIDDYLEMNESMITGESKAVIKHSEDFIYSGSFVSSGNAFAKVVHVGADNYIQKIMKEVRKFKEVRSDLMDTFSKVAAFCAKIVLPIGILLFLQATVIRKLSLPEAIVTISTVLLGLLPMGLVLLTSISFAVSVFRLGRKQTLVQSVYAIETLSKVDVICIDKTGTLTQGMMSVSEVYAIEDEQYVNDIMANYLYHTQDTDSTTQALQKYFESNESDQLKEILAFSSSRKWGAMKFEQFGNVYVGAPDFLMHNHKLPKPVIAMQDAGARVLLVAQDNDGSKALNEPVNLKALAYIIIRDELRDDASPTLDFFNKNEVVIKIISGDHIKTLLAVASNAGIQNGDRAIDVSKIETDAELEEAVMNYNVIGRASPYQKQIMVKMLQKNHLKVAMVGDGVNDVLALRSADCSIAMGAGSDAAIQVAEVVLLDNKFATMVDVVMEGRLVTNNIARSASMYYLGTLFTFILSMISMVSNNTYPFIPIQMTIMSMFVEGMPSTLITFESSHAKPKEPILRQVLRNILPIGISLATAYILLFAFNLGVVQRETMLYYTTAFLSYMLVVKLFQPMNWVRGGVLLISSTILVGVCIVFYSLLNLIPLTQHEIIIVIALIAFIFIFWKLVDALFTLIILPIPRR